MPIRIGRDNESIWEDVNWNDYCYYYEYELFNKWFFNLDWIATRKVLFSRWTCAWSGGLKFQCRLNVRTHESRHKAIGVRSKPRHSSGHRFAGNPSNSGGNCATINELSKPSCNWKKIIMKMTESTNDWTPIQTTWIAPPIPKARARFRHL
jgi:hypothetical protein